MFDAKYLLEILKAPSRQTAALALAAAGFLILHGYGVITTDPWMITLAAALLLLSGFLVIGSVVAATVGVFSLHQWIARRQRIRADQKAVGNYIPHMTENERAIVAYLLAKNQKMFEAESNGGYANTLLSRGIVRFATVPGAQYSPDDVPMAIPDHIWDVLKSNEASFPYTPRLSGRSNVEVHPWRVPWMLR